MVVSVDTDGDGEPEATFPMKWALALLTVGLAGCFPSALSFL